MIDYDYYDSDRYQKSSSREQARTRHMKEEKSGRTRRPKKEMKRPKKMPGINAPEIEEE
jgi:hypothetical protein